MRTVALVLALTCGGCALAAAGNPNLPVSVDREPSCNVGKGAVVADGLGGALLSLTGLLLMAADEPAAGLVFGLPGAAFIGSAVSGSRSADRCRAAFAEHRALVAARDERVAVQRAVVQTERRLRAGSAAGAGTGGPVDPFADGAGPTAKPPTATPPTGTAATAKPPTATPPTGTAATAKPPAVTAPTAPPPTPTAPPPARPPAETPDDDPGDDAETGDGPADEAGDEGGRDWAEFWREVKP